MGRARLLVRRAKGLCRARLSGPSVGHHLASGSHVVRCAGQQTGAIPRRTVFPAIFPLRQDKSASLGGDSEQVGGGSKKELGCHYLRT